MTLNFGAGFCSKMEVLRNNKQNNKCCLDRLDRQQAEQPLKLCRLYLLDDIGEVYGNQRGVERGQKSGAGAT